MAFPLISAGAYGWPLQDAARAAVETVRTTPTAVERVVLVAYDQAAETALRRALSSDQDVVDNA